MANLLQLAQNIFGQAKQVVQNPILKAITNPAGFAINQSVNTIGNIRSPFTGQTVNQIVKQDPWALSISRLSTVVPQASVNVFKPVLGQQRAEDIGYGLRGALQLTPLNLPNITGLDTRGQQLYRANAPQAPRQQLAQQIGRTAYGYALTAPIGGGSLIKNTLSKAIPAMGVGAGLGGVLNKVSGGSFIEGAKQGAYGGLKAGPLLSVTNPITSKLITSVGGNMLAQQTLGRSLGGAMNALEDEILGRADGLQINNKQRAFSFLLGAAMTNNKMAWDSAKSKLETMGIKNADQVITKAKSRIKTTFDQMGSYRLTWEENGKPFSIIGSKQDAADYTAWLTNKGIKYDLQDLGMQGGFVQIGKTPKPPIQTDNQMGRTLPLSDQNLKPEIPSQAVETAGKQSQAQSPSLIATPQGLEKGKKLSLQNLVEMNSPSNTTTKVKPPTDIQSLDPKVVLDQKLTKSKGLKVKALAESQSTGSILVNPISQQSKKVEQIKSTRPQPLVDQAQPYFNTDKLNINKKSKQLVNQTISEVKPQVEKLVGKKLSNKEVVNVANNTASILDKTITRQETLAWEAKMLRARQLVAQQASDGKVTQEYIDNLLAIKSQGADIARKLQSLSIGADPKEITAKQAILESILKVTQNTDEVLAKARGVDFNDQKQATAFYRQFIKPTSTDWLDLLRYNSMLSSPNTHFNNAFSNYQGTGIIAPIEKTVEGSIDAIRSAITGKPRTIYAGEGAQYAKGYYSNVKNAANRFVDVMRGRSFIKNPDTRYLPLATSGPKSVIEKTLNFPMRLLEASDQFFTSLTEGGSKQALEYRYSKLGKTNANIDKLASDEAAKRLFRSQLGANEGSKVLDAIDTVANSVQRLKSNDNPIVSTISKFTLPFLRTPTNILKQGVEYSPLGVSTLWGATNKQQQLARSIIGSSIALGTAMLVGSDRMTWAEPTSEKQRNAFRAAGLQPYSVKIGDKWFSYSKLHPALGFNMALVAGLRDAMAKKTLDDSQVETVLNGLAKWLNFYADQSYLKNIGDMVAATKGDSTGIVRFLSNYPTQVVPFRALLSWVNRIIDPYQRQIDSSGGLLEKQLQQIALQIPMLSGKVPIRIDENGNPIENQNRLINAVSPMRITTENPQAKKTYDEMVTKSQNTRQEDVYKQKVLDTGQEQTFNGKKYYLSKELDTKTGEYKPVVKSIKISQTSSDIYSNLPKEYETLSDSPKNILQKVTVYGTGIFKDPKGTLAAIKSGQPIRKVSGDAVVLERLKNLSSLDQGDKATEVDHIIPIALGGDNSESNLAIIPKQDNRAKGIVDTYLSNELKAGRITKAEAQKRDLNWRGEIANLPAKDKAEATKILSATPTPTTTTANTDILSTLASKEYKPIYNSETQTYSDVQIKVPTPPQLTGLKELDAGLKSKYSSALSTAKTNIEKLYLDGQITAQEANAALTSVKTITTKAKSSKTKKYKKITVKTPKLAKIKIPKVKLAKIKVIKPPKLKLYKPKKSSVKLANYKTTKFTVKGA